MTISARRASEPGSPADAPDHNVPEDRTGDGPVTLADRLAPDGEGSPGANQARTEPMDPLGTHGKPAALPVPDLDSMNVSGADPQASSHPLAAHSELSTTGALAHEPSGHRRGPRGMAGVRHPEPDSPA